MTGRIPFDRAASYYDETRGGTERGRLQASWVEPWLPAGGRVLEVGVGTGVIAAALADSGFDVLGLDLSLPMLARAQERLPRRLAAGDALRLPVRTASVDAVVLVHVVQLLPDVPAAVAEVARVLAPDGRLVVCCAPQRPPDHDATGLIVGLRQELGFGRVDEAQHVIDSASAAGLRLRQLAEQRIPAQASPEEIATQLEERIWAWTWDIDDVTWRERVAPVLDALRALPDPERPRDTYDARSLLVLER